MVKENFSETQEAKPSGTEGKLSPKGVSAVRGEAVKAADQPKGEFKINNWDGYPDGPKPEGPFRILEGTEYEKSRDLANQANADLHRNNPGLDGLQIHEIHPVKFGGDPVDPSNKIAVTRSEHAQYTAFWNKKLREQQANS
ncbi:MAG: hypothetical protein MUC85_00490 [Anaerolineales bacterium]|nr:hypothetical protein [Anaerolineales bacterium]